MDMEQPDFNPDDYRNTVDEAQAQIKPRSFEAPFFVIKAPRDIVAMLDQLTEPFNHLEWAADKNGKPMCRVSYHSGAAGKFPNRMATVVVVNPHVRDAVDEALVAKQCA